MKTAFLRTAAVVLTVFLLIGTLAACGSSPAQPNSGSSGVSQPDGEPTGGTTAADGTDPTGTVADGTSPTTAAGGILRPQGSGTTAGGNGTTAGTKTDTDTGKTVISRTLANTAGATSDLIKKNLKSGSTVRVMMSTPTAEDKVLFAQIREKWGVTVEPVVAGYLEAQTLLGQMVSAGDPPDLAWMTEVLALQYIYGGIVQPLDKYVDKSDPLIGDRLGYFTANKKEYALADIAFNEYFVYYNKSLLREKGIKDPYTTYYLKDNWTFETFKSLCSDIITQTGGKVTPFATWNYALFMYAAGGRGVTLNASGRYEVTIDQPAEIAGMQMMRDLCEMKAYYFAGSGYDEFRVRKIAMLLERPGNAIGDNDYYNRMEDEIGMVPLPRKDTSSKYYAPCGQSGLFIPMKAKNPWGGAAYALEYLAQRRKMFNDPDPAQAKLNERQLSVEHAKIREEYLKKATPIVSMMDGMTGWYSSGRSTMWDMLMKDLKQPVEVVDAIKSNMKAALKRTTG